MIITEKRTKEVLVQTGFICDVCKDKLTDMIEVQEKVSITFTGGYGSIFGDGDTFSVDLCQNCCKDKLGKHIRKIEQPDYSQGKIISAFDW